MKTTKQGLGKTILECCSHMQNMYVNSLLHLPSLLCLLSYPPFMYSFSFYFLCLRLHTLRNYAQSSHSYENGQVPQYNAGKFFWVHWSCPPPLHIHLNIIIFFFYFSKPAISWSTDFPTKCLYSRWRCARTSSDRFSPTMYLYGKLWGLFTVDTELRHLLPAQHARCMGRCLCARGAVKSCSTTTSPFCWGFAPNWKMSGTSGKVISMKWKGTYVGMSYHEKEK